MNQLKKIRWAIFVCCALLLMSFVPRSSNAKNTDNSTYSITVVIKNIRNKKGRIQLHLYRGQKGYTARKGWKEALLSKKEMTDGRLVYKFTGIKQGLYGLAVLDDENKNTKMDYGWIMPKEGFGFGDYIHRGWDTPHFDDFKFYLKSDKKVLIVVRYL